MAGIYGITESYQAPGQFQQARRGDDLGKQEFLMLLVAQLKNQDPLNPISDQEFIAQLAQFSSLEAMQNVAASMDQTRAAALVGKQVTVMTDQGWLEGRVDAVHFEYGSVILEVEGQYVPIESVARISE